MPVLFSVSIVTKVFVLKIRADATSACFLEMSILALAFCNLVHLTRDQFLFLLFLVKVIQLGQGCRNNQEQKGLIFIAAAPDFCE